MILHSLFFVGLTIPLGKGFFKNSLGVAPQSLDFQHTRLNGEDFFAFCSQTPLHLLFILPPMLQSSSNRSSLPCLRKASHMSAEFLKRMHFILLSEFSDEGQCFITAYLTQSFQGELFD